MSGSGTTEGGERSGAQRGRPTGGSMAKVTPTRRMHSPGERETHEVQTGRNQGALSHSLEDLDTGTRVHTAHTNSQRTKDNLLGGGAEDPTAVTAKHTLKRKRAASDSAAGTQKVHEATHTRLPFE